MSVNMTQRLEIRKISDLIPYKRNARTHSPAQIDQLRRSLREFGFVTPVLIDSAGNVIAGHGRLEAAKLEGIEEAPCVLVEHLSEAQRRAYILADNRLAEAADWDKTMLSSELLAIQGDGLDISLAGFEDADLQIEDIHTAKEVEQDVFDETPPETPLTKRGYIWQLGKHRLMCGDATLAEDVDRLIDGEFMRLTVTSPPYGVGKDYEQKGIESCVETMAGAISAISGKTLIIAWNVGDLASTGSQFTEPTGLYSVQLMKKAGYGLLYTRIWKKPGGNFAGNNPYYTVTTKPVQDYEYLFAFALNDSSFLTGKIREYLFNSAAAANITDELISRLGGPQFMRGHWFTNHQWAFIDEKNYRRLQDYCLSKNIPAFQRDYSELKREYLENTVFSHCLSAEDFSDWGMYGVWQFSTVHERLGGHAAAFPVELPARYIKMHSYPGSLVLDPFGGTGTTLIACEQLERRCRMMELDPKYCDVIIRRWEALTGEKAVLLNG